MNEKKCNYILKNGKQCGNKPGSDALADGFCFRHRTNAKQAPPKPKTPIEIDKNFCTFVLPSHLQCKNKPEGLQDRCWLHNRHRMNSRYQYNLDYDQLFSHFFKKTFINEEKSQPAPPPPPPQQTKESDGFLGKLNIATKESWKTWIVKNHPDKGGDNELFIRVLKEGRNKFQ
jgi:hypothetical protein